METQNLPCAVGHEAKIGTADSLMAFNLNACADTIEQLRGLFESIAEFVQKPDDTAAINRCFLLAAAGVELADQRGVALQEFLDAVSLGRQVDETARESTPA